MSDKTANRCLFMAFIYIPLFVIFLALGGNTFLYKYMPGYHGTATGTILANQTKVTYYGYSFTNEGKAKLHAFNQCLSEARDLWMTTEAHMKCE